MSRNTSRNSRHRNPWTLCLNYLERRQARSVRTCFARRNGPDTTVESKADTIEGNVMSVYRVTELIGTSTESWENAAAAAVTTASKTLRDLRVAEVVKQDIHIDEGGAITYRTKLQISFKYEGE